MGGGGGGGGMEEHSLSEHDILTGYYIRAR